YNLRGIERGFDGILQAAGPCTEDPDGKKILEAMKSALDANNVAIQQKDKEFNTLLKLCAAALTKHCSDLKANHHRMNSEIAVQLAALKAKGQATDLSGLETLLRQKTSVATEIANIERRTNELKECRQQRAKMRVELKEIRDEMTTRRKAQLAGI